MSPIVATRPSARTAPSPLRPQSIRPMEHPASRSALNHRAMGQPEDRARQQAPVERLHKVRRRHLQDAHVAPHAAAPHHAHRQPKASAFHRAVRPETVLSPPEPVTSPPRAPDDADLRHRHSRIDPELMPPAWSQPLEDAQFAYPAELPSLAAARRLHPTQEPS